MARREKISVMIDGDLLDEVKLAAKTDDYGSVDHVMNDALLWWQESRKSPEERQASLRQAIQDGIDSGPAVELDLDELFEGVKRRGRERLEQARKAA